MNASTFRGTRERKKWYVFVRVCVCKSGFSLFPRAINNNNRKKKCFLILIVFSVPACVLLSALRRRQRGVLSAWYVHWLSVCSLNIFWFRFSAVSGADDVECSAAASNCAFSIYCVCLPRLCSLWMRGKTSSPKNYVSSRWYAVRVAPKRERNAKKLQTFFFFLLLLFYYVRWLFCRASIPMPNNYDKTEHKLALNLFTQKMGTGATSLLDWTSRTSVPTTHEW